MSSLATLPAPGLPSFLLPLNDPQEDADYRLQISELPTGELKAALSCRVAPAESVGVLQLTLLCRGEQRAPLPAEDLLVAVADWAESLARACRAELAIEPSPTSAEVA